MRKSLFLMVVIAASLQWGAAGCGDAATAPKSQSPEIARIAPVKSCQLLLSETEDYWVAQIVTIPFTSEPQATVSVAKCCFSYEAFQLAYAPLVQECSE